MIRASFISGVRSDVVLSRLVVAEGSTAPRVKALRARLAGGRDFWNPDFVGCMIDHQFGDYPQIALMRRIKNASEIIERAEVGIDVEIIGDVVAVVTERDG